MNLLKITETYFKEVESRFSSSMGRRGTRHFNQGIYLDPAVDTLDERKSSSVSPICALPRNRGYRAEIGAFVLGLLFLLIGEQTSYICVHYMHHMALLFTINLLLTSIQLLQYLHSNIQIMAHRDLLYKVVLVLLYT